MIVSSLYLSHHVISIHTLFELLSVIALTIYDFLVFKRLKLSLSVQRQYVFTLFAFSVYYSLMLNLLYKIYLLYIGKQTLLCPSDKKKLNPFWFWQT